jgi:hypothetical protein
MNRQFFGPIIATAWLFCAITSHAQDVRTQAPCSPVVDRTQGNVTLTFNGGCTVGITPAELKDIMENVLARRAIPPELLDRYETVSRSFGVTDTALTTFFRILGENKVSPEDLDAKLREVAARHLTLLKQAEPAADDDPQVAGIKKQAVAAIGAGDYGRAEGLLQRAFDADLAAARRAQDAVRRSQDAADKRFLTTAKTRADIAQLKLTELRYAAAAQDFQEAANLVPGGELLVRSGYLNSLGTAARRAGNYPLADPSSASGRRLRQLQSAFLHLWSVRRHVHLARRALPIGAPGRGARALRPRHRLRQPRAAAMNVRAGRKPPLARGGSLLSS